MTLRFHDDGVPWNDLQVYDLLLILLFFIFFSFQCDHNKLYTWQCPGKKPTKIFDNNKKKKK